jgi:HD-GYP domain-containing protein (c-di-GMP phosphodiesterase class II)
LKDSSLLGIFPKNGGEDMNNHKQAGGDLAALLSALSFATGLGFGGHMEHGLKSAYIGLQIADALTLVHEEREAVFYGALLKDVACTVCAAGIAAYFPYDEQVSLSHVILVDPSSVRDMVGWLSRYVPLDARFPSRITKLLAFMVQCGPIVRETMRSHCEVAELFARQLGFPEYVQQTLRLQWERWDGRGMAYGLKGRDVPITARILHIAQVIELTYRFSGPEAMRKLVQDKRGTRFDPEVVDIFLTLAQQENFWETFDQLTQEAIIEMRPSTTADQMWEGQIEQICEALADFVDIKTRETWHHSRKVAEIAVGIGGIMGLEASELSRLRCAALVHDIGKVTIPLGILTKGEQRTGSDWETYRLHTYYTQRILERTEALQSLAQTAASHHEWVNGQGYHRQLHGDQIPLHGRILATANTYVGMMQQQESRCSPAEVVDEMSSLVGTQLDRECYDALVMTLAGEDAVKRVSSIARKAGNLTERESEVLRLLARGQNTPQIGRSLGISKKTVEHHLAHIYNKIGVTSRTAAVVYAVQHGLV